MSRSFVFPYLKFIYGNIPRFLLRLPIIRSARVLRFYRP